MSTPVLAYGNKELRTKCKPVDPIFDEKEIQRVLDAYKSLPKCAGLAANQIGVMKRIIIAFGTVYLNPEVVKRSDEIKREKEGSMSIPSVLANVNRPKKIVLKWTDTHGRQQKAKMKDYLARVILHEIDQIDGICFVDRISDEEWEAVKGKVGTLATGVGGWPYDLSINPKLVDAKNYNATRKKI